ncbi:MAG: outer membrane lipoprotein-sorting protein [candidate division KSB1 bacterium]|nr:outer membrane lipoprotein-sorting protein [candidate division KSB1 bacterium]
MFIELASAQITPEQILKRVDEMLLTETTRSTIRMIIYLPRGEVRHKTFEAYSKGRDTSFLEFTEPARDRGTRYLKIGKSLWMFFPRAGKSILIKGHMLRQGMMGSDFSYEDATETSSLLEDYQAQLIGNEKIDDTDTFVLELIARKKGVTYYRRMIWVDKQTYIPIKNQFFAQSGKLLKTFTMGEIKKFGSRYFPTQWVMKDELRENTRTVMELLEIEFDIPLSDDIFTKANLERH